MIEATPEAVGAEIRRLLLTLRDPSHTDHEAGHYGTDALRAKALDHAAICWNGSGKMHSTEHPCVGRPKCLNEG